MASHKATKAKAQYLSISRSDAKFTAAWKVPAAATKSGSRQANNADIWWYERMADTSEKCKSAKNQSISTKTNEYSYSPTEWFPSTDRILEAIKCKVRFGYNKKYNGPWCDTVAFAIEPPEQPGITLSMATSGDDNGKVTAKVEVQDGDDGNSICARTMVRVLRATNIGSDGSYVVQKDWTAITADATYTFTESEQASVTGPSNWIKWRVEAYGQGPAGNGETAVQEIMLANPATPRITSATMSGTNLSVMVESGATEQNPVTSMQVQVTKSASEPTDSTEWDELSGAEAPGFANGIFCNGQITADRGEHIWLRVVSENEYGTEQAVSNVVNLDGSGKFQPVSSETTATTVSIDKLESAADNESFFATVSWTADSYDETVIQYSSDADFQILDEDPNEVDALDSRYEVSAGNSCRVKITKNVDENTIYYVRARRQKSDDDTQYSDWTAISTIKTDGSTTSSGVTLSVPSVVAYGSQALVSWTVGGDYEQTAYRVGIIDADGSKLYVTEAEGSDKSFSIGAEYLQASVSVWVESMLGGAYVSSDSMAVKVMDAPTVAITAADTVTAKPYSFTVSSTNAGAEIHVKVVSCGGASGNPDGSGTQADGETVYSNSGSGALLSCTLDESCKLLDGCSYRIIAYADTSELCGEDVEKSVSVAFAHQAVAPSVELSVDSDELTVTIAPTAPDGAAGTDVFDVYRVTPDGCELVAEGVTFGESVIDRYAPFGDNGDCEFIVATRTADGDVDYTYAEYSMPLHAIRFDWMGGSLQCEYDLSVDADYSKQFERRSYLDGTFGGYYGAAVEKSARIGGTLLFDDADAIDAAYELANYDGPVFVRTPDGLAFEANVDVSGLGEKSDEYDQGVTFDATPYGCGDFLAEVVEDAG